MEKGSKRQCAGHQYSQESKHAWLLWSLISWKMGVAGLIPEVAAIAIWVSSISSTSLTRFWYDFLSHFL